MSAVPRGACDCHIHIYDPRFPLVHPERRAVANAGPAEYRHVQRRLGTTRVVIVQAAAYGTDNRAVLAAVETLGRESARGIAVVHPDVTDTELDRLHAGGIRGLRFTQHDPRTAVTTPDMIEPLANRTHERGWHAQLHLRAEQIAALADTIDRLPGTIVFDHMARLPQPEGTAHPAFALMKRWLDRGRAWVKLSGPYLDRAPDTRHPIPGNPYPDASKIAREYARIAPERIIWGSDWPHPTETAAKPDDALLFDLLAEWTGSERLRRKALVDNPAALYGFPPIPTEETAP